YSKMLSDTNSVSIALRQNRFSEGYKKDSVKSEKFFLDTIDYINKSVELVKTKTSNPKFFIWSNDFTDMENYFDPSEFIFIKNKKNKILNDFNLFKYSKHFIVGPTSFHWWGAWLNSNKNSLCIRPLSLNVSNNKDLWPEAWFPV
ncbi:alpha-1,2-fucosyltransferase, partial [Candidatus Pelagibacter sp.]|nr:alpha-1,2-fucosyltransferase [Candidatus Pelagibacter sp.]